MSNTDGDGARPSAVLTQIRPGQTWTMREARADPDDTRKGCVLEVDQPETQDRSHYQRLVDAGDI